MKKAGLFINYLKMAMLVQKLVTLKTVNRSFMLMKIKI
jgi:hypothetical protein